MIIEINKTYVTKIKYIKNNDLNKLLNDCIELLFEMILIYSQTSINVLMILL